MVAVVAGQASSVGKAHQTTEGRLIPEDTRRPALRHSQ